MKSINLKNKKKGSISQPEMTGQPEHHQLQSSFLHDTSILQKWRLDHATRLIKAIGTYILLIVIVMLSLQAGAQPGERNPRLRERISEMKLRKIRNNLNLDEATFQKFKPLYLKYEQEMMGLDLRRMGKLLRTSADSLSDEEAHQLIMAQMEQTKKMLSIREAYYPEFRKILKPQQVIRLYQTENEIRRKVMAELKKRRLDRN